MAIKGLKPRLWATPQDVRALNDLLTEDEISNSQIEPYILRATDTAKMHLYSVYGDSDFICSSYAGIPTPHLTNTGSVHLYGASAGASAYTELFTVDCRAGSYTVQGDLQGALSGATYGSNLQTSDFSLLASAWSGTPQNGDLFYVSTYDIYKPLVTITAMLATAYVFQSKFSEAVPNASGYAEELEEKAMKMLNRLTHTFRDNALAFDSGARISGDVEPIAVPYEIDKTGVDVTDYYSDRGSQEGETALDDD